MEKNVFGAQMEIDESTGMRVLSFIGISNFALSEDDCNDPDRIQEANDY